MVVRNSDFEKAISTMPLVAILRGVGPQEVLAVADALIDAGFKCIEVPLNSPEPFDSIERLVQHCPSDVLIGAGTVLNVTDVERLSEIGAKLVVTPNTDTDVIDACVSSSLIPVIGAMTPTEALLAIRHGAAAVKVFPAGRLGPHYAKDMKAIIPTGTRLLGVGGVGVAEMEEYCKGGYDGFGIGSSLYKPGKTTGEIAANARQLANEWLRIADGEK